MKHYGDITKLSGFDLPIVDVITGGSPCQDLSVAGKRAGMAEGTRSGLFIEQIRIIKEMRERDRQLRGRRANVHIRPRYMVWENVPGALSSNKGEDFKVVLEETAKIADRDAVIPRLEGKQKWSKSGCVMGDGWSIAWRIHDAQFWGVAQRRKRIALVADFGGLSAPEILFERRGISAVFGSVPAQCEGLSGNPKQSREEREEAARAAERSTGKTGEAGCLNPWDVQSKHIQPRDGIAETLYAGESRYGGGESYVLDKTTPIYCLQGGGATSQNSQGSGINEDVSFTLNALDRHAVVYNGETVTSPTNAQNPKPGDPCHTLGTDSRNYVVYDASRRHNYEPFNDVCETVQATYGTGGNNQPLVVQPTMIEMTSTKNTIVEDGISPTLTARMGTGGNQVNAVYCMDVGFFQTNKDCSGAMLARQYKDPPIIYRAEDGTYQDKYGALMASGYNKLGTQEAVNDMYVTGPNIVRRLTPKECERLQGFPDNWTSIGEWEDTKGKMHKDSSDSARYKALGNSIALPFWFWLLRRISAQYERPATLGSLFDGIGGFPLCWERCNGKGTAVWASEIEEFPIAVTKKHFPEAPNENE